MKKKKSEEEILKMFAERLEKIRLRMGLSKEEFEKMLNEPSKEPSFPPGLHPDTILFGRNVRNKRIEKEWSAEQLAVLAEVPVKIIQDIETGDSDDVRYTNLYRIAEALEVPLYSLFLAQPIELPKRD